jgi:hypothetical protein
MHHSPKHNCHENKLLNSHELRSRNLKLSSRRFLRQPLNQRVTDGAEVRRCRIEFTNLSVNR